MIEEMEKHFPENVKFTRPDGGLFLWCTTPVGTDMQKLIANFLAADIAVVPGATFMPSADDVTYSFRMNYSMPTKQQIVRGVETMGRVLKESL